MPGNLPLHLRRLYHSIWFLPTTYVLGSLMVLVAAPTIGPWLPMEALGLLRPDALERILTILASSMLAVTIFSLGTMVAALEAASSAATPRSRVLLSEDRTAQTAIATFIGAFIFSILGIIGLSTGSYNAESVASIFVFTILVIAVVIIMLISWIHRLSQMGGIGEVIGLVADRSSLTFDRLAEEPLYGGLSYETAPANLEPIYLTSSGYLQHIGGEELGGISRDLEVDLYLLSRPGSLVGLTQPVLLSSTKLSQPELDRVRNCFVFGEQRTFEEDPLFGLLVLSEIASRGLSPGINDPGTAICVLSAVVRVLRHWRDKVQVVTVDTRFPRLHVSFVDIDEVIADGFRWIARDGAKHLEVALQIQNALAELRAADPVFLTDSVERMSREAFERAQAAMASEQDLAMLTRHREALRMDRGSEWFSRVQGSS